jgi:uncharacterized lipoprotein YddW (UPF0748 family)
MFMKILTTAAFLAATLCLATAAEPPEPAREFRGAWVATVFNIDWPSKAGLSTEAQKAELRAMLDRAAALELNAIVFQVRPACDALYASKREPWSSFLTGKQGAAPQPFYDPLEFAITEAHARGLELHAWFNPFRAIASTSAVVAPNHITRTHPEWVRRYGKLVWLDPGEPDARKWSIETIMDVTRRYDVDGIHLDDYFYPYPIKGDGGGIVPFPDDRTWSAYQSSGGELSRDDWRRENINGFVRDLYSAIKAEKRWVKFGISPFGIWRPRVPETIEAQLDSFAQLYADSRHWLQQGWCDYYSPQLYWGIQPAKQSFPVLFNWWTAQNAKQRHLWPGIATERVGPQRPAAEMPNQIAIVRENAKGSAGHIHWSFKALRRNTGGVSDLLRSASYQEKALVPASPWLADERPPTPSASLDGKSLSVKAEKRSSVRWWAVQEEVQGRWRLKVVPSTATRIPLGEGVGRAAVRAVSPSGVTGEPTVIGVR